MSVIDLLKKLFPFLVSAAEKTFNKLEDSAKNAGINGSLFAQIIKENTSALADDLRALIKSKLGLSDAQLIDLEEQLTDKYNVPIEQDVIQFLQAKFKAATDDILHSSLANEVAAITSIILSKGKLTWVTLLMGVGEYVYRRFVKGQEVALDNGKLCPPHYVWNGTTCVPDVG